MRQHYRVKDGPKGHGKRARAWEAGRKLLTEWLKKEPRPLTKARVRHLFIKARKQAKKTV